MEACDAFTCLVVLGYFLSFDACTLLILNHLGYRTLHFGVLHTLIIEK